MMIMISQKINNRFKLPLALNFKTATWSLKLPFQFNKELRGFYLEHISAI